MQKLKKATVFTQTILLSIGFTSNNIINLPYFNNWQEQGKKAFNAF